MDETEYALTKFARSLKYASDVTSALEDLEVLADGLQELAGLAPSADFSMALMQAARLASQAAEGVRKAAGAP